MKSAIPVVIVAGFLGSGKTTLLNHLLRNNAGFRIGVVVNDFGSINIDSMLVAGQVDAMVSFGNGCLCCAVDTAELDGVLDRLAQPRTGIDVIIVEASGLAEPRSLIRMVIASPNRRIRYGGLIEVVDAAEYGSTRQRHPEIDQHLRMADLVLVNKIDRVSDDERTRLIDAVAATVDQVPVLATSNGRVDPALLFDADRARGPRIGEQLALDGLLAEEAGHDECGHAHLHDAYDSVSFTTDAALDPRSLVEFLEDPPSGVFRIKGVVRFAVTGVASKYVVHTVGHFVDFRAARWGRGEARSVQLVVIGIGLNEAEIRNRLSATEHHGAELLPVQALLRVGALTTAV